MDARSKMVGAQTAASLGYTGAGVKVGFVADGIDINNPAFIRPNGQHVFVDYQDFSGSGTASTTGGEEANIDAGSIAVQGTKVYNVSYYSDLPLNRPCDIRIEGVAPGASLVGLDAFGGGDDVFSSVLLKAIDGGVTHDHVDVLNESFGSNSFPDTATLNLIKDANDAAVAAGVTVTVSSGDAGVTNTIGSPASDARVISVGATTTYQIDAQTGYGGARLPGVTGWLDGNISSISSGGESEVGRTVNVVAPGELNRIPCSANVNLLYTDCTNYAGKASAFLVGRGDQRVWPPHRRGRRPGHPGLPSGPQGPVAHAGGGQADHHEHGHPDRGPGRPGGLRAGQHLLGGAGGAVVRPDEGTCPGHHRARCPGSARCERSSPHHGAVARDSHEQWFRHADDLGHNANP